MCVDGYVLDKPFSEAIDSGESDDVEYMAGMVANEGVAFQVAPFGTPLDTEKARGYIRSFLEGFPMKSKSFTRLMRISRSLLSVI